MLCKKTTCFLFQFRLNQRHFPKQKHHQKRTKTSGRFRSPTSSSIKVWPSCSFRAWSPNLLPRRRLKPSHVAIPGFNPRCEWSILTMTINIGWTIVTRDVTWEILPLGNLAVLRTYHILNTYINRSTSYIQDLHQTYFLVHAQNEVYHQSYKWSLTNYHESTKTDPLQVCSRWIHEDSSLSTFKIAVEWTVV